MAHAKPRLLVCAYAFSPVLGSEFAQGWNYVREMAGRYRLTVLVGSSDGRMGGFAYLTNPEVLALGPDVEIVPVAPDRLCQLIRFLDVRVGLTWLFVLGLRHWHRLALDKARALHAATPFVAVHQLGPVGFRNPGLLYRLGIPAYWGPIGGFQFVNLAMAWRSDRKYGALCLIRNLSTWLAARSATVRQAMRRFDRLSFATETNRANTARLTGRTGPVLSDQAVNGAGDQPLPDKGAAQPLRAIWVGSVDGRKNIAMLLDIAAAGQALGAPLAFTVVGSGALLARAKARAQELGLGNVTFTGQIPRSEVQSLLRAAHALCFTSLSEANTSTLFEALEAGCIPFALDLDGFSTNITPDIGYLFSIKNGWDSAVAAYAAALDAVARAEDLRAAHGAAIARLRPHYAWARLAARHAEIIDGLIDPRQPTPSSTVAS